MDRKEAMEILKAREMFSIAYGVGGKPQPLESFDDATVIAAAKFAIFHQITNAEPNENNVVGIIGGHNG